MEVERIRQCSNCEKLYWAGRMNKPACSIECGNVVRQQRWRDRHRTVSNRTDDSRYMVNLKTGVIHDLERMESECRLSQIIQYKDFSSFDDAREEGFHACPFCIGDE